MNADSYIKGRLAAFCIEEAQQSEDNMVAVAHVLRNRVDGGWEGGDWMRMLDGAEKLRGSSRYRATGVDIQAVMIQRFLRQVDDIYDGSSTDELTNGALYYCELHNITNAWFLDSIVRDPESHPRLAQVGLTTFFG